MPKVKNHPTRLCQFCRKPLVVKVYAETAKGPEVVRVCTTCDNVDVPKEQRV